MVIYSNASGEWQIVLRPHRRHKLLKALDDYFSLSNALLANQLRELVHINLIHECVLADVVMRYLTALSGAAGPDRPDVWMLCAACRASHIKCVFTQNARNGGVHFYHIIQ